ncbi:Topoisomerase 1-associated factor 1 [Marasmius crinis-equi]|uniref:Topoisomerase 1-associated factor 1 n=1 Tax=Marasmius crinis-equi TaxID=585013 RepID=A0ABR3FX42_9AGAR
MSEQEVIEIYESEESEGTSWNREQRDYLEPIIRRVVHALGGWEEDEYKLGDEASGCLKDLKKLWRKDDTDDERTVARIFWESRVLVNDLVPVLLVTAGRGMVEDKRAIAAADLMTAMTWPIDLAEELKELDDQLDRGTDYTQLLQSHLHYKAALLKPGVIQALFGIMIPPLVKPHKERTERDMQIVNVVLHLFRNLAFIKDPPPNVNVSSDQAEFSGLQSKLIRALSETHTLELLLTIAANVDRDLLFDNVNTLVLEILYLLFRGVKPSTLAVDQKKKASDNLKKLIQEEEKAKRKLARFAPSRHSRFGTTISVQLNPNKKPRKPAEDGNEADSEPAKPGVAPFVVHHQQGMNRDLGSVWDMSKRQKAKKGQTVDELSKEDHLTAEARQALQTFATDFLDSCFNPFLSTLLKDIRSERPKITEKDNLRLLFVAKWFLEFFLGMRSMFAQKLQANNSDPAAIEALEKWKFGLVAEVVEQHWIVWVLKRMREAVEEKPKLWTELQAGTECLTQLLMLIDTMSTTDVGEELQEAADVLQHQLVYSGEVLDIAFDSLRTYKPGTQSLAYLTSGINMGYALFKVLERYVKKSAGDMYVRKKTKRRTKKGGDDVPEEEDLPQEDEEVVHETMFTLESYEMRFAHADITHTLLAYLSRYREFSSDNMKRVVSLLHRQAVRAKAEGLFFQVSTLTLFKTIMDDQRSLPRDQPHKDLISLINYILRRFFKAVEEDTFLAVEAFFPKNRGNWKQFSSWEPETKSKRQKDTVEDTRFPPDVVVKKGYSWSDQLGIAIAALVEDDKLHLVTWLQEASYLICRTIKFIGQRQRVIEETDGNGDRNSADEEEDEDDEKAAAARMGEVSVDAKAKMKDYMIPYDEEQAEAATKNPHLRLLFRLSKFSILDEVAEDMALKDAEEPEWYVPRAILPHELQTTYNVIAQFLEKPFDLEGKKASELLSKKRRRRRRRVRPDSSEDEESGNESGKEKRQKRKQKKAKEDQQYKSRQFIEDSDEEFSHNLDDFMALEKARREKAATVAATLGEGRSGTMRATGTKKRRRKAGDKGDKTDKKKRRRGGSVEEPARGEVDDGVIDSDSDNGNRAQSRLPSPSEDISPQPERPRPKPRRVAKGIPEMRTSEPPEHHSNGNVSDEDEVEITAFSHRKAARLVLSDDDE